MLNFISTFARRYSFPLALIFLGLLCVFGSAYLFDSDKVGLGPEFIIKIFGKFMYAGVAYLLTQWIMRRKFTTLWLFSTKGDKEESDFGRIFRENPSDPRLWITTFAYAMVFIGVCLLLALAF